MSKRELQNEIKRLTEVLEITSRRHEELRKIVGEFQLANRPRQFMMSFTGPKTTK